MSTWDSRHNFKIPRWGHSLADVDSGNATEPPSGQQDTGWVPGVDSVNGRWWNYLHQQASYWFAWAENTWFRRWTVPHLMRTGKGSTAVTTAGTGLSVDVTTARVLINGAMYQVPAANDLALAAADATNPRFDLVVARLNGLVPEYFVVTGTPAASPAEPSPSSTQVPIARVRVNATSVVPDEIVDRREYGVLELDRAVVSKTLVVGEDSGDPVLRVRIPGTAGGPGSDPIVELVPGGSGEVNIGNEFNWTPGNLTLLVSTFLLDPEAVLFINEITRKFDINAAAFRDVSGSSTAFFDASVAHILGGDPVNDEVVADVRVPNGATITECRAYVHRENVADGMCVRLIRATKGGGVTTELGNAELPNGSGGTGDQTMIISGLSHVVNQSSTYYLKVEWADEGGGPPTATANGRLYGAEVSYEVTKPFDGL